MHPKGILVTGKEKEIWLLSLVDTCPSSIVAIAIGGGGKGDWGGGGSGHVDHTTNFPQKAYIKMAVHPGSGGEDSYIRELGSNRDGELVRGRRGNDVDGSGNGAAGENAHLSAPS